MTTSASIGYGSTFGYGTDGVNFTPVAQCEELNAPAIKVTDVKMSNLDSPNRFHEYRPGMGDGGDVTVKLIFKGDTINTMYGFLFTTQYWRIQFSDGPNTPSNFIFQGYFNEMSTPIPLDGESVMTTFKFKVTQKPTFTANT